MPTYEEIKAAIEKAIEKEIGPNRQVYSADPDNGLKEMVFENCWGDFHFYTPEQWEARRETIGEKSLLSFAFEGIIYSYINYGESDAEIEMRAMGMNPRPKDVLGAITEALAPLGLYPELGYAWSLHVYKI